MKLYDLNSCPLSPRNGFYGGQAGSKEGIIINGEPWIVKYPKNTKGLQGKVASYASSPLSEYLGSHIYEILGYPVHETIMGERKNKLVVACKDFCKANGDLMEIRTAKNAYNEMLEEELERSVSSTSTDVFFVQIDEMFVHFKYNPILSTVDGIKERFWDCIIIDGLINNNDRNNGNWGLMVENGSYVLAPIYDNGAAFSNKMPEDKVLSILGDEKNLKNNALNTVTAYGRGDNRLYFRNIWEAFSDNADFRAAVVRVTDKYLAHKKEIADLFQDLDEKVCSKERAYFYFHCMEYRMNEIVLPAYERIKGLPERGQAATLPKPRRRERSDDQAR